MYHAPFEFVRKTVLPIRRNNHRKAYRDRWWIHGEPRPAMQAAIRSTSRFILTPRVGKHRIVVWATLPTYPSDATVVFSRDDDCLFGLIQSQVHSAWALHLGTRLETRPRYTPTTCFETFPLPDCVEIGVGPHPGPLPKGEGTNGIAAAAKELDELRNRWLNPPEWTKTEILEFSGSVDGPWARYVDPATVSPLQKDNLRSAGRPARPGKCGRDARRSRDVGHRHRSLAAHCAQGCRLRRKP